MNRLKRFMAGRYGGDQLSTVLLIASLILNILGTVTRLQPLILLGYVPLAISIFRMLSKDINRRRMENYKFSIWLSPLYSGLTKIMSRIKDSGTYSYFTCPGCKTRLRVPKGKGRLVITCPKCKTELKKKT